MNPEDTEHITARQKSGKVALVTWTHGVEWGKITREEPSPTTSNLSEVKETILILSKKRRMWKPPRANHSPSEDNKNCIDNREIHLCGIGKRDLRRHSPLNSTQPCNGNTNVETEKRNPENLAPSTSQFISNFTGNQTPRWCRMGEKSREPPLKRDKTHLSQKKLVMVTWKHSGVD